MKHWLFAPAWLCLAVLPVAGRAESRVTDRGELVMVVAGTPATVARLEGTVRELLGRLDVRVAFTIAPAIDPREVVTPRGGAGHPVARVWLDLATPGRSTLYLVDGPWERILVRHLSRDEGDDEVAIDELGHVIEAAVEALLDGAQIGIEREAARRTLDPVATVPAPPPAPVVTERAGPMVKARLGLAYEAQLYASQALVTDGPVATLRLARGRWGAWFDIQYRLPLVVSEPPVGIRLDVVAPRIGASFDALQGAHSSLRLELGAGADVARVEPLAQTPNEAGVSLAPTYFTAVLALRGGVVVERTISADLAVFGGVAAEIDPTRTRFVLAEGDGPRPVLAPWPVRPALTLGLITRASR